MPTGSRTAINTGINRHGWQKGFKNVLHRVAYFMGCVHHGIRQRLCGQPGCHVDTTAAQRHHADRNQPGLRIGLCPQRPGSLQEGDCPSGGHVQRLEQRPGRHRCAGAGARGRQSPSGRGGRCGAVGGHWLRPGQYEPEQAALVDSPGWPRGRWLRAQRGHPAAYERQGARSNRRRADRPGCCRPGFGRCRGPKSRGAGSVQKSRGFFDLGSGRSRVCGPRSGSRGLHGRGRGVGQRTGAGDPVPAGG